MSTKARSWYSSATPASKTFSTLHLCRHLCRTRLKALRKSLKEADRRVRQAVAKLSVETLDDKGGGGGSWLGKASAAKASAAMMPITAPGGSVPVTRDEPELSVAASTGTVGERGRLGEGKTDDMMDKEVCAACYSGAPVPPPLEFELCPRPLRRSDMERLAPNGVVGHWVA